MKRILIFIGLKIIEIATFCLLLFVAYNVGNWFIVLDGTVTIDNVMLSILIGTFFIMTGCLILWGLYELIKANYKWAKKLSE